jgi:CRP-like cAMP-binding protein
MLDKAKIHKVKPSVDNHLLGAMLRHEFERMRPGLELVHLAEGQVLTEAGDKVSHTYFIMSGMVSLISLTEEGGTIQVAMVGREGVIGIPSILRTQTTMFRAKVQSAVVALRIKADALRAEVKRCSSLHEVLSCYTHTLVTQIAQTAVCNRFHPVEKRLARWLLLAHDSIESDEFNLTHEDISGMLGTSRSGISGAAGTLQRRGLISYARGRLTILDRKKLEAAACECYRVVSEELRTFLDD